MKKRLCCILLAVLLLAGMPFALAEGESWEGTWENADLPAVMTVVDSDDGFYTFDMTFFGVLNFSGSISRISAEMANKATLWTGTGVFVGTADLSGDTITFIPSDDANVVGANSIKSAIGADAVVFKNAGETPFAWDPFDTAVPTAEPTVLATTVPTAVPTPVARNVTTGTPASYYNGGYYAGASSYYYRNNYDVTADCAIDGRENTAWNSNRVSVGEWIEICTSNGETVVAEGFTIANGYWKSNKVYKNNARVARLDVYCDGIYIGTFDIADIRGEYQSFNFSMPVAGSKFKFEIADAYRGGKYQDCCITELSLFGTTPEAGNIIGGSMISGNVRMASDGTTPISGAAIEVYQYGQLLDTLTTDGQGAYSCFVESGDVLLKISAGGYIPFEMTVNALMNTTTYVETLLMVAGEDSQTGEIFGRIINALTGDVVDGVIMDVRKGWNNDYGDIITTFATPVSGEYGFTLPAGNYTAQIHRDGFVTNIFNFAVNPNARGQRDATISPYVEGNGFRIVLTWGENPRDLDSHVDGPLTSGGRYHVYYLYMSQWDNGDLVCNLDVDDRYSYGPETITLTTAANGTYYYYVHHYAGSGTMSSSSAQVAVYQGSLLISTFNVPTRGSDIYWNVFAIRDNQIIPRNTITAHPETDY